MNPCFGFDFAPLIVVNCMLKNMKNNRIIYLNFSKRFRLSALENV